MLSIFVLGKEIMAAVLYGLNRRANERCPLARAERAIEWNVL
jgi:hypothetical protein